MILLFLSTNTKKEGIIKIDCWEWRTYRSVAEDVSKKNYEKQGAIHGPVRPYRELGVRVVYCVKEEEECSPEFQVGDDVHF